MSTALITSTNLRSQGGTHILSNSAELQQSSLSSSCSVHREMSVPMSSWANCKANQTLSAHFLLHHQCFMPSLSTDTTRRTKRKVYERKPTKHTCSESILIERSSEGWYCDATCQGYHPTQADTERRAGKAGVPGPC